MTLIITNDDGIEAPGIRALLQAVDKNGLMASVVVAAPRDHQSGCGHQVTTTQAIPVKKFAEQEYAIGGTPADCIRIATSQLCQNVKFVLSGINSGGNLGVDAYISGTIAAVREAAMHEIPGIAFSQYRKRQRPVDWEVAARWTASVLADLLQRPWTPGTYWNVNLPHLLPEDAEPEIVFCQPCTKPLPANYRIEGDNFYYVGEYAKRERTFMSDVDICFSGKIAVTQLQL
jgi:5'-nucleotidase